jgi:hypothetical protein|tara:strand:+ start:700 stop:969 length:270 start_codon:yes stop_codon:yes gene_type:complete
MKDKEYIRRLRQIGWRNNFPPKATEEQINKARQSACDTYNAISKSVLYFPNQVKKPTKAEIKKVYKKKAHLSKNVIVYKPILPFERKDI